ncbi:CAIB/BAIF family protein [Pseudomonas syringae pv. actinidiae ICMP 19103]|uniref:Crotonobetainyl-CoA:carnitine CoA-transferase CaiB and related acyl-CoA transferase n=2 Tax=Pseudomonas syringae TaxID=317 RepID=A0A2V0QKP9_PSESF|nr:CoA transferase [Pseudomonas syringae pv. actinidiae ICMP 9853]EGH68213.1 CAIB/BAIF family protein [Pseudomonas syringae pv. actinidiae str. M302091]EPM47953.1 CAIB/BAIF family protein [Pseudomonas syringae pv. actinidiae ICMP 19103]EPM84486.1 CAIB/BAIF family protein [Pseudomonas syringae pv. actinidiae ICMP 19068]EPM94289.1 CAIB/BAIF family protein [Pseudomonas syringae pv. actinidiae ICMP 19104]EPN01770.1 CAIB/BAIF family protein [Pseudomonas syringae pv. actinidiae ICMP 19102]EPN08800.
MGALSHIRVLDLSRVLAGPWAGQILADLGADVIKVERPGCGDDTRAWGPPFLQDAAGHNTSEAAYYLSANRNKQSVTIDFTRPEGQKLVKQLAAKSDIVIENFKVGGLAAYELDYASLKAINSRLIYCSITGFGQSGPYATRPGYDFMIQALGGLMSLTGLPEGEEGAGPVKVGVALTDILTGLYSTTAILAALANRDQSNVGQHIDMALLDVQVACLANQAMNYLTTGVAPERLGNAHPNIVPYQSFPTADGDLILTVGNDSQFRKFAEVAGQSQWADDPRFLTNTLRVAHRAELIPLIRQVTVFKATAQWVAALEAVGVPCAPVNDLAQVFADPHVVARGLAIELPHALGGKVPQVASPIRLSETPVEYRRAPPMLGEHTAQVLEELLGLGSDEVASLRAAGVL